MSQATVGSKYQIVIPKEIRRKIKSLKPGVRVVVRGLSGNAVSIEPVKQSWAAQTFGVAKKAWNRVNPVEYIEKLRNEWDIRP